MPFAPVVTFANGSVMNWSDVDLNDVAFRNWARSIPIGDVNAGAIRREHLVRPVVSGPLGGSVSTLQHSTQSPYGIGEAAALLPTDWGSRRRRLTITPNVNDGVKEAWYLPVGETKRFIRSVDVEIHCTLEWQTRSKTPATGGVAYPDGAGGPAGAGRGGYFAIHSYQRSSGVETTANYGVQHVYSEQPGGGAPNGPNSRNGAVCMVDTCAPGVWDFMLVYHRGGAPDALLQIDVSRANMTFEVL